MEMSGALGAGLYGTIGLVIALTVYLLLPRLIHLATRTMASNAIDEAIGMHEVLHAAPQGSKWLPTTAASIAFTACLLILSQFGITTPSFLFILLSLCLLTAAAVDLQHHLLPDLITFPLLWAGLLLNLAGMFASLESAVIGAAAGYGALFLISRGFYMLTGRVGMGDGDLKLLAVLGAWGGWQVLPVTLLIASILGLCFALASKAKNRGAQDSMFPFGPALAAGGILSILYGTQLTAMMLG